MPHSQNNEVRYFNLKLLFAFCLILIAGAISYLAWSIQGITRALPELLLQVENTNKRIDKTIEALPAVLAQIPPITTEMAKISGQIQPILLEVENYRKLFPDILAESVAIRQSIPPILTSIEDIVAETARVRETLPSVMASVEKVRQTTEQSNGEIKNLRLLFPIAVKELQITRAQIPEMLERADQIVKNAETTGRKASEGAVSGFFSGLIKSPISLVRGIGASLSSTIRSYQKLTDKDTQLLENAMSGIMKDPESSPVGWHNIKSGNSGQVFFVAHREVEQKTCALIKVVIQYDQGDKVTEEEVICP